jgi:hypothetical protein
MRKPLLIITFLSRVLETKVRAPWYIALEAMQTVVLSLMFNVYQAFAPQQ